MNDPDMRGAAQHGFLIEEQDRSYLAAAGGESSLLPLQAASCTYRLALGPRAGQKVLSLQSVASPDKASTPDLCAKLHGFTLHAAVHWGGDQRKELEHLCRYITRPAIANERLKLNQFEEPKPACQREPTAPLARTHSERGHKDTFARLPTALRPSHLVQKGGVIKQSRI